MSNNLQPIRGMKDLMPEDCRTHNFIKDTSKQIGELYGFAEASTPILEHTEVFDRTLGETSDVVSKEIYNFADRKGRNLALRPEFTAGTMRAVISNGLTNKLPQKLFSSGPVFRYDRPQEGRQRQFHQINFEHIGAGGAFSDAEIIKLAAHILETLGINDVTLELNSLGCKESRAKYQEALVEYFSSYSDQLSSDSTRRLSTNPLRILDSKDEADKNLVKNAPVIADYYTDESVSYFSQVKEYLSMLDIKYIVNPRLVRGLDYYSHTAFEFTSTALGAQGTVLAGGRYDGLCELMGGPSVPAIGFAAGVERIAMLSSFDINTPRPVWIIPIGEKSIEYSAKLSSNLRKNNIITTIDFNGKIAKRVQKAVASSAKFIIFIGDEEVENNSYKLKDLDQEQEKLVSYNELLSIIS